MNAVSVLLRIALVTSLVLPACSPWTEPSRPSNVPADAVLVYGGKTHWWIRCWFQAGTNRCQIFNASGKTLSDEVFLPYDRGATVPQHELQIDPRRSDAGKVWLKNGRILLPQTNFDRNRKALERRLP